MKEKREDIRNIDIIAHVGDDVGGAGIEHDDRGRLLIDHKIANAHGIVSVAAAREGEGGEQHEHEREHSRNYLFHIIILPLFFIDYPHDAVWY